MEAVCPIIQPVLQIVQSFLDAMFTPLAGFGFTTPNLLTWVGGVLGCSFT
jgi:hypothetical protein